jgi:hypothetical protein
MKRLFVDSSVLFSACYSGSGRSRDLLVSFDRKHLVGRRELEQYIRAPIVLPQEAWDILQRS